MQVLTTEAWGIEGRMMGLIEGLIFLSLPHHLVLCISDLACIALLVLFIFWGLLPIACFYFTVLCHVDFNVIPRLGLRKLCMRSK